MDKLLGLVIANPLAAGAGAVGMLCFATYPAFRRRALLLTIYLGNNLGFATHYALLGQWTASAMNMGLGVQTLVVLGLERRPGLRWAYYGLVPVLLGATVMTWHGWSSLLAATATALSTLGRSQRKEAILRLLMLVSALFWLAHDLVVGSLPGLVADISCVATGGWMLSQQARATIRSCLRMA
jgi:hypothetical protein